MKRTFDAAVSMFLLCSYSTLFTQVSSQTGYSTITTSYSSTTFEQTSTVTPTSYSSTTLEQTTTVTPKTYSSTTFEPTTTVTPTSSSPSVVTDVPTTEISTAYCSTTLEQTFTVNPTPLEQTSTVTPTSYSSTTFEPTPTVTSTSSPAFVDCCDPSPENGYTNGDNFTYGSTVCIYCDPGYILNGSKTIFCQYDGSWDEYPTCVPIDCGDPTPENGYIIGGDFTFGRTVCIYCNPGYILNGSHVIFCQDDGSWDEYPTCDLIVCGDPTPENGNMIGDDFTYDDTVTIFCDAGYILNGVEIIICMSDGFWDEYPTCDSIDCGTVKNITFGTISLNDENNSTYGSTANITCDTGYETSNATISCLETGHWEVSNCTAKDCGTVDNITFGTISLNDGNNSTYGSTANVTCDTGYETSNATISCLGTGEWGVSNCTAKANKTTESTTDHTTPVITPTYRTTTESTSTNRTTTASTTPEITTTSSTAPEITTTDSTTPEITTTDSTPTVITTGSTPTEMTPNDSTTTASPITDSTTTASPITDSTTTASTTTDSTTTASTITDSTATASTTTDSTPTEITTIDSTPIEIASTGSTPTNTSPAETTQTESTQTETTPSVTTPSLTTQTESTPTETTSPDTSPTESSPAPCSITVGGSLSLSVLKIKITLTIQIEIAVNCQVFKAAIDMLKEFYDKYFGNTRYGIAVNKVRKGSLIVDYTVLTPRATLPKVALANAELASGQTTLTIFNKTITPIRMEIEGTNIPVNETRTDELICKLYETTIEHCEENSVCKVIDELPTCAPVEQKDNSLILGLVIGITVFVVCVAVCVLMVHMRRKRRKGFITGGVYKDDGRSSVLEGRMTITMHHQPQCDNFYPTRNTSPGVDTMTVASDDTSMVTV